MTLLTVNAAYGHFVPHKAFGSRRALLVFDEVEDVFNDDHGLFGRKSTAQTRKAWINRMLEENVVPTIWLSNSVRGMDPAFIRALMWFSN